MRPKRPREDEEEPKCRPIRLSTAVIDCPGLSEPGRLITVLIRVGRHFDYSSSSHGLLVCLTSSDSLSKSGVMYAVDESRTR